MAAFRRLNYFLLLNFFDRDPNKTEAPRSIFPLKLMGGYVKKTFKDIAGSRFGFRPFIVIAISFFLISIMAGAHVAKPNASDMERLDQLSSILLDKSHTRACRVELEGSELESICLDSPKLTGL